MCGKELGGTCMITTRTKSQIRVVAPVAEENVIAIGLSNTREGFLGLVSPTTIFSAEHL